MILSSIHALYEMSSLPYDSKIIDAFTFPLKSIETLLGNLSFKLKLQLQEHSLQCNITIVM